MKATLTKTNYYAENEYIYRPDDVLILEWKVYDIDLLVIDNNEPDSINIKIYKKGTCYACYIWIKQYNRQVEVIEQNKAVAIATTWTQKINLFGSGKGYTGQKAVETAFASIGIKFDSELPQTDPNCRPEKMVTVAIDAITLELGITHKLVVPFSR
jgi:hypothetical protein